MAGSFQIVGNLTAIKASRFGEEYSEVVLDVGPMNGFHAEGEKMAYAHIQVRHEDMPAFKMRTEVKCEGEIVTYMRVVPSRERNGRDSEWPEARFHAKRVTEVKRG